MKGTFDVMDLKSLLVGKKDEILAIAAKHGASNIRIFGSTARGEAKPDSDIDFLVTFRKDAGLLAHSSIMIELRELLGREVDVISDKALDRHIRSQVLKEAIPF